MVANRYSRATPKSQTAGHYFAADGSAQKTTTESETDTMSPVGAVKLLLQQLREAREYSSHFFAAKADCIKLALRHTGFTVVRAALGFVLASGLLVIAGWFVLSGTAGGLAVLFGGRWWLGNLVTGILVLGGLGFGIDLAVSKSKRTYRERMVKKYEARQARQQSEFGRSASN